MPYVLERQRALSLSDMVVVLSVRQPGTRSRVILGDNSLYQTLTRPRTLVRRIRAAVQGRYER